MPATHPPRRDAWSALAALWIPLTILAHPAAALAAVGGATAAAAGSPQAVGRPAIAPAQAQEASPPDVGGAETPGAGSVRLEAFQGGTRLSYVSPSGERAEIGVARGAVSAERVVLVPAAAVLFSSWDETEAGVTSHRVSVSLDRGGSWSRPQSLTRGIPLKAGLLEPSESEPPLPAQLLGGESGRLFIVQMETTGLEAWRRILSSLGVEVLSHLPPQAHIVRMDGALLPAVASQPFVRWVGIYRPGYRIEPGVLAEIAAADCCRADEVRRYHLMTFTPGLAEKSLLAEEVRAAGGRVDLIVPGGYALDATLSLDQVARIASSEHLLWLDRWSAPENDMDIVRQVGGADYIESVRGYSGQGVSGEVMDNGVMQTHQDFDGIRIHGPAASGGDHGTCTYGIVFGNGRRDNDGDAKATGNMPSAQGWFYDYDNLTDRYAETAELVQSPIFASFQSNSWGDARTRIYTSKSFEMDDIIWQHDIPIFQSQSNAGNQDSRPQAWAKNVISVGAVDHQDTASLADDCWCSTASIGPAEDGRIKPDLAYWYDWEYTTDTDPGGYASGLYYDNFGGTSGATPITAGIGGLILQMWADNVLGNNPQGTTVFEKRPHASTTKAMMINTAEQYPFSGTTHDLTRMHQGWGLPSARRFYDRAALLNVVDETELLRELDVHTWTATVSPGQSELKITLVYTDRAGTTSSALHRINDVTLKVTSADGATVYWGNNGLETGVWSVPGGSPDSKNTVENVFVQNPVAGPWTIEISADDLNQDAHVETPDVDQDYALVVYGAGGLDFGCPVPPPAPAALTAVPSGDNRITLDWTGTPTARQYRVYRSLGGCGGTLALIGTVPAAQTSFADTSASGGSTYGYIVRAAEACESADSNCATVTAAGPCILPPSFAGLETAASDNVSTCGVTLSWAAATPACGGPVRYNVHRGTSAAFTPSDATRVASCLSSTGWQDTRALSSGVTYYYVVRAEDLGGRGSLTCGGVGEINAVVRSARVQGPTGTLLSTGFETGLEGWTPADGSPPATKGAFVAGDPVGSTAGGQPAEPASCASGAQCLYTMRNKGGNPDQGDVDGGETLAVSPAFDGSGFTSARLTLSRWHFNSGEIVDNSDRFALDLSNDNGATWTSLELLSGVTSVNQWTPVAFDLQSFRPLTSQMRVRVRSSDGTLADSTIESAIDGVLIEGSQVCSTLVPGAPGASAAESLRVAREGPKLRLSWGQDCGGAVGYGIYRGDLAGGYGTLAPLAGACGVGVLETLVDPGTGSYFYLVAPNDGAAEGSLGLRSDGTRRPQPAQRCYPRANPVNACAP